MPRRPTLPTSDQTTLVDTFTCSIAVLFVLILSLRGTSTEPFSVVSSELLLLCSSEEGALAPVFRVPSDEPSVPLDARQLQQRLDGFAPADSLSLRITVAHAPQDDACRDTARRLTGEHNELASAPSGHAERPYLILDLIAAPQSSKPVAEER